MTENIGFIGLGAMGAPMLARLAAVPDFGTVRGHDADPATMRSACDAARAEQATSVAGTARESDLLFTCLPNNAVLLEAYLGTDGIASAIRPGSVTVDCSTVGPDATRAVHAGLRERGVEHLDASMLGSVAQAREGTISFVVGGSDEALNRARPALEATGGLIRHCGPSGAGNTMKLVHQTLVAGHAVAVAEALALCEQAGADLDAFYDIVTQGTGFAYSRYFEKRVPRMRSGDFSPLFMLKFMAKDARLAREMLQDQDAATLVPALDAVIATLEEGERTGLGEEDFSAACKVVRQRFK